MGSRTIGQVIGEGVNSEVWLTKQVKSLMNKYIRLKELNSQMVGLLDHHGIKHNFNHEFPLVRTYHDNTT